MSGMRASQSLTFQSFPRACFGLGQLVSHRLLGYRGVIVGVDASYAGSDEWYERMATSRPPKEAPWYNVLVDGASHQTYVAEENLEVDERGTPVQHPHVWLFFDVFEDGVYISRRMVH